MLMKQRRSYFLINMPNSSRPSSLNFSSTYQVPMLTRIKDSFAFYNGHLSEVYKRRRSLLAKLKTLDAIVPAQTPSASTPAASSLFTSYLDRRPSAADISQRRQVLRTSFTDNGISNLNRVAAAIESGEDLDIEQIQMFERIIKWYVDCSSCPCLQVHPKTRLRESC